MKRVALILALSLCGCDLLGPEPISMKLTLLHEGDPVIHRHSLSTNIECILRMTATAAGPSNQWVRLGNMRISFFAGPDQREPISQLIIAADTVRRSFGQDSVETGDFAVRQWSTYASFPFAIRVALEFETASGRRDEAVSQRMACGPDVRGVNAAPPVVTARFVPDPTLPASDRLIEYTATSGLGLWETVFVVSGQKAHVTFDDQAKAVTRQVRVPFGFAPPGPVLISVTSFDVAMQPSQVFELVVQR